MSNRLDALNTTQRRMIAASLEIDGHARTAARAVIPGNEIEFTYNGFLDSPISPKAIELEALTAEILAEIGRLGVDALVAALRGANYRPATPITEVTKDFGGLDAYSVRIMCPTCEGTKRHDGQACGRCAGYGHMWEKPAPRTEADQAEADAKLAEEAATAAKHRADGEAIRAAAARRRARLAGAKVGTPGPALAALPEETRRGIGTMLEDGDRLEDIVALAVNGTNRLDAFNIGGVFHEATPEQESTALDVLSDLRDLVDAVGRDGAELTLRPIRSAAPADVTISEYDEKIVADFAADLDALTAEKVDPPRVYALRQAEASGRLDLVGMICDSCFATKARVARCFRCEGHGMVWATPSALEAKAAAVEAARAEAEDDWGL